MVQKHGGTSVNKNNTEKERNTLEAKMATVFAEKIKQLSTDLQKILIDDMVTAFENRLNVLNRVQTEITF
jgi:hypothetical protein